MTQPKRTHGEYSRGLPHTVVFHLNHAPGLSDEVGPPHRTSGHRRINIGMNRLTLRRTRPDPQTNDY